MPDPRHERTTERSEEIRNAMKDAEGDAGRERRAAAAQKHVTQEESPEGEMTRARLEATNADVPGRVADAIAVQEVGTDLSGAKDFYAPEGSNGEPTEQDSGDTPIYDGLKAETENRSTTPADRVEERGAEGDVTVSHNVGDTVELNADKANTETNETTPQPVESYVTRDVPAPPASSDELTGGTEETNADGTPKRADSEPVF